MNSSREIEVLIRAKYPILNIVSWEERRVEETLGTICTALRRKLHVWSITQGMKPTLSTNPTKSTLSAELEALAQAYEASDFTVILLKDFHPYMRDARTVRLLRDLATRLRSKHQTLVILSPSLTLPTELEKDVTVVDFPLPTATEIGNMLDQAIAAAAEHDGVDAKVSEQLREQLIHAATGLTMDEIEAVFARSLVEKKKFDVDSVVKEKQQIIRKSGLLEFYPVQDKMSDVGGMGLLKKWLSKRGTSFSEKAREFGLPSPKGILLLGVQGCGKSLVAKAVAAHYNLPMLKLDVGRIFGSLVGQSEENIRKAIRVSESVSPCVLWADELEKGFAGVSGGVSDSGTTARVFATFLSWMQEKTAPVFLIATANDVSKLPPEMLRKGRFDEIFFVDLPTDKEREGIFEIHLRKRGRDPKKFKLAALSELTEGYSGAEIEQVVVGGLYTAFDKKRELTQKDIEDEAKAIVPLSRMMAEDIEELREWARMRARPAS